MNYPNLTKLAKPGCAAVCLGIAALIFPQRVCAAQHSKPNFIIILTDDLGYGDIGPFGSMVNRTPNLDRMTQEGMKLTSFYTASLCSPSRAQLLTGCYAKRVSLPRVLFPADQIGLGPKEHTVADLLKLQGYATMAVGKWHLGDQPQFLPTAHGFDHYLGLPYSNDMGQKNQPGKPPQPPLPLIYDTKVKEAPVDQQKLTSIYTREAEKFITENSNRPFFLYLSYTAVHVPLFPGAAFLGKSANGKYGDMVEEVDWSVGCVLKTLKNLKLDSNTFVIFTSDNGPWMMKGKDAGVAGPLRGAKASTWEGGVRVPTIAWWPGKIPQGTVSDTVTHEMDLLPTLVKLAGGDIPADNAIDGKNIWPVLSGETKESPHDALYFFNGNRLEAVRAGPWKLAVVARMEHKSPKEPKIDPSEPFTPTLYNLDADIGETTDVAVAHPDIVEKLQGYISRMDKDLGAKTVGPGARPCGQVRDPKPLQKIGAEYD